MWSHYAKEHSGISIEYELQDSLIDKLGKSFFFNKISYQETLVDSMKIIEEPEYVRAFFTKAPSWEYENECRLITFADNLKETYKLEEGITIKSITFGYKTNSENKDLVKTIVKQYNPECKFYEIQTPDFRIFPFKLARKEL